MLRSWPNGSERELAPGWDRSPSALCWSPDGRTLYATAENVGQHSLFAIDARSGKVNLLIGKGQVSSPAPAAGRRLVFGLDHLNSPVELWSIPAGGGDPRPVTRINAGRVAAARMGEAEQFPLPLGDQAVDRFVRVEEAAPGGAGDVVGDGAAVEAVIARPQRQPPGKIGGGHGAHGRRSGQGGSSRHGRWHQDRRGWRRAARAVPHEDVGPVRTYPLYVAAFLAFR
jgi:hypothetical protein